MSHVVLSSAEFIKFILKRDHHSFTVSSLHLRKCMCCRFPLFESYTVFWIYRIYTLCVYSSMIFRKSVLSVICIGLLMSSVHSFEP